MIDIRKKSIPTEPTVWNMKYVNASRHFRVWATNGQTDWQDATFQPKPEAQLGTLVVYFFLLCGLKAVLIFAMCA